MMHDASHALHVSFVLLNFFTRRLVMVQILHFEGEREGEEGEEEAVFETLLTFY